jgi:hypothetical protein
LELVAGQMAFGKGDIAPLVLQRGTASYVPD